MRKAGGALLVLTVLVLGLILHFQRSKGGADQPEQELSVERQAAVTGAPRLAAPLLYPDSSAPKQDPEVAVLDAGGDAGRLPLDEQTLVERTRALLAADPRLAEELAREGRARFGDSSASDERDMQLVIALLNQQRRDAATSEAYYYFAHHRSGRHVQLVADLVHVRVPRR